MASDDQVRLEVGCEVEHFDAGTKRFSVTLPDGVVIPIEVEYVGRGWDARIDLPDGSKVEALPDDD